MMFRAFSQGGKYVHNVLRASPGQTDPTAAVAVVVNHMSATDTDRLNPDARTVRTDAHPVADDPGASQCRLDRRAPAHDVLGRAHVHPTVGAPLLGRTSEYDVVAVRQEIGHVRV